VESLGTLLGVFAHPDDETYLTAGLMAQAAQDGRRVACITATRGEEGSWDEEKWPTPQMGRIREAELLKSLAVLGVTEHYWLDYHDGKCAEVPSEEGIAKVAAIMADVQPDSVFSFGPDGMTDHADHKATCAWATAAFERVAKPGAKLYYATTTPEWAEKWVPVLNKFNVFMSPDTPPVTPREELAVALDLEGELLDLKVKAINAHESQIEGFRNAFGPDFLVDSNRGEYFRLVQTR
jgi:LmbE family N-acetylglucosaminyl deacetylase